jgi:uncharacterized damage-inducible protein DinB
MARLFDRVRLLTDCETWSLVTAQHSTQPAVVARGTIGVLVDQHSAFRKLWTIEFFPCDYPHGGILVTTHESNFEEVEMGAPSTVAAADPIDILVAHDRWATHNVIRACEGLTDDNLHRTFEMGLGTLHATIVHMIGAVQGWSDALALRPQRPWIDEKTRRTPVQLLAEYDDAAAEFTAVLRAGPMDQELKRERLGVVYIYTRATVITHVLTHAMHHRAQCLNMLRHVGVTPLPQSSVVEWSRAGRPMG